mgnify:CR=1 FL=1
MPPNTCFILKEFPNNNLIKTTTEVEEVDELDTDINKIIGK